MENFVIVTEHNTNLINLVNVTVMIWPTKLRRWGKKEK